MSTSQLSKRSPKRTASRPHKHTVPFFSSALKPTKTFIKENCLDLPPGFFASLPIAPNAADLMRKRFFPASSDLSPRCPLASSVPALQGAGASGALSPLPVNFPHPPFSIHKIQVGTLYGPGYHRPGPAHRPHPSGNRSAGLRPGVFSAASGGR